MKALLLVTCLAWAHPVVAAEPEKAAPEATAPGETWIECFIAVSGMDSPEAVYDAALEALERDDWSGLQRLAPDQCTIFRIAELEGIEAMPEAAMLAADESARAEFALLVARVGAEALAPSELRGLAPTTWLSDDLASVTTDASSPLRVEVAMRRVDGRWYLSMLPSLEGDGDAVVMRYRKLAEELLDRIHAAPLASSVRAAAANWRKARGRDVRQLNVAKETLDGAPSQEMVAIDLELVAGLGEYALDTAVFAQLVDVYPILAHDEEHSE